MPEASSFRYCLNTSTLRGQKLTLAEIVEIAAKAGYQAIEPWIEEIQLAHAKLRDLRIERRDGVRFEKKLHLSGHIAQHEKCELAEFARRDQSPHHGHVISFELIELFDDITNIVRPMRLGWVRIDPQCL